VSLCMLVELIILSFKLFMSVKCYELILQVRGMYMHMMLFLLDVNYCVLFAVLG
jgi:hypothetical protein